MQIKQDETFVTVSHLDVHALGEVSDPDNSFDHFRFDQASAGDQPIGPEPTNGPVAPESDGDPGTNAFPKVYTEAPHSGFGG